MTLLQEAFNSFEKAQIVMASEGLIAVEDFNGLVWENPTDLDIRGDITPLTVK